MDDTFSSYLQRLEFIAFFSGYPLLYALVLITAGNRISLNKIKGRIFSLLPFAYALVGTLYLGFQLKNYYPEYSIESLHQPYLFLWGISVILFWIPAIAKYPVASLVHSFVFFFLVLKDIFLQFYGSGVDKNIIRNDMNLYSISFLVNSGALITVTIIYHFLSRRKLPGKSSAN